MAFEDNRASDIISHISLERSLKLDPVIQKLLAENARGRKSRLIKKLKKMDLESTLVLDQVHPSWIAQAMLRERPQAAALILAHLPTKTVGEILEHLPPSFKESLPEKTTGLKVSRQILKVAQEGFTKKFLNLTEAPVLDSLSIEKIYLLEGWELQELIKCLGCYLVALAFKGLSEKALVELVKSLSDEDSQQLFDVYKALGEPKKGIVKEAQVFLLSLSSNFRHVGDLIVEAGVVVLSKALFGLPGEIIQVVRQKCTVRQGHFINRVLDECKGKFASKDFTKDDKKLVLDRIKELSSVGRIDNKWNKLELDYG